MRGGSTQYAGTKTATLSGSRCGRPSVADAIDAFALANGVAALSIDGPQGWRDAGAPVEQGVGRACERRARTLGKTGVAGTTFPANQIGWIGFSIELFDELLRRPHVRLANDREATLFEPSAGGYWLLECFPTVTWRTSGLRPLPAKGKRPDASAFARALAERWRLAPLPSGIGHDDLQAVVAALPAAALLGAGVPVAHGVPSRLVGDGQRRQRVEGIIWDAVPRDTVGEVTVATPARVAAEPAAVGALDSGRKGKAVEHLVAASCILASDGALNVSTALVDDEGVDLVFHLRDHAAKVAVQVKSRDLRATPLTSGRFLADVRVQTFRPRADLYLLFVAVDVPEGIYETAWLVPSEEFGRLVAPNGRGRLRFSASLSPSSRDRWSRFRVGVASCHAGSSRYLSRLSLRSSSHWEHVDACSTCPAHGLGLRPLSRPEESRAAGGQLAISAELA